MIQFYDSFGTLYDFPLWTVILTLAIIALFIFAFYLLRSIGIYKLAKSQGVKNAFMAFIPGLWTFTACKTASESRFFRTTLGRIAWVFTLIVTAQFALNLAYNLFLYVPIVGYALQSGANMRIIIAPDIASIEGYNSYILQGIFMYGFNNPYTNFTLFRVIYILNYVNGILAMFAEVALIFIYFAIFRKFWPERYWMASILSAFGLFSPLVFAIRNRQAVDYEQFIRERMTYYGNPYNPYGQNPYGRNESQNPNSPTNDSPFADFDEEKQNVDPFSEFDDEDKNRR